MRVQDRGGVIAPLSIGDDGELTTIGATFNGWEKGYQAQHDEQGRHRGPRIYTWSAAWISAAIT
jgi:hypothetical protein